ncbi:MAG TPA: CHAD domain-containing protein [Pyrinomonadaceae bacterium]|jgi:CHAD domain-containing protein
MAKAREIVGLNCEAEALSGIRLVLRTRFEEMYERRAEALNWEDIEGVHDMRVASRRLRSAIKDFRDFLGRRSVPKRRLKKVADALGDVRDQDVAIEALEKLRAEAGAEVSADVGAGIDQLIEERAALRGGARVKLAFIVAEKPLAELRENFLSRLESVGEAEGGKDGRKSRRSASRASSFRQAGRRVISARIAELHDLSDSLHHPFDIEPLHELRIAAKRLRYAMELFAPCWGGTLTSYAHEVSELQSSLGELRDCDTWIDDLGARLDRNRRRPATDLTFGTANQGQIRQAAVWLLDHFTKERGKHFRHALARWHEWELTGFFAQLESVLDGEQQPPASETDAAVVQEVPVVQEVSVVQTPEATIVQAVAPPPHVPDSEPQTDAPEPSVETSPAHDNHVE